MEEKINFVKLLSTFNIGDIALIKGLLDKAEIKYFFQWENMFYISGAMDPSILMVNKKNFKILKELLKNFDLNFLHFIK